jgi:hypothetical protein
MTKFAVWRFQNAVDFDRPEIIAVCKTQEQAIEIVTSHLKESADSGWTTHWFRIAPSNVALPGFE